MKVVNPTAMLDSYLISSNLVASEYEVWDSTKAYLVGDMVQHNHVVYMATKGLNPDDYDEYSSSKEYIVDNYVKVTDKKRIYKSLQGDLILNIDEYDNSIAYISNTIVKVSSQNKLYKSLMGDNATYTAWSSSASYAIGDYVSRQWDRIVDGAGTFEGEIVNSTYFKAKKIYKCLKAHTNSTPKDPLVSANTFGASPYWTLVEIVNQNVPPYGPLASLAPFSGTLIEWDISIAYDTHNYDCVKVDADAKIYEVNITNTGNAPKDNLTGSTPKWMIVETYTDNIEKGVWEVYATLNTNHYPPDNTSGTIAYWSEYGVLNIGYTPSSFCEGDDEDYIYWTKIGSTNDWALFDDYTNTYSVGTDTDDGTEIDITIRIDSADTISFFNLIGRTLELTLKSDDNTVLWNKIINLIPNTSTSWFEYYFGGPADFISKDLFFILPSPMYGNKLNIKITSSGICQLGMFKFGRSTFIGQTLYSPKFGIIDYSKKTTNDYGETSLSIGAYKKYCNIDLMVEKEDVDKVFTKLASFRGKSVVVVADNSDLEVEQFQSMLIFGFLNDWYITVEGPNYTVCTAEVTGLI